SPAYEKGEVDALRSSSAIVRSRWAVILGLFILFHLFIPLVFSAFFDSYRLLWKTPLSSLTLSAVDTFILLLSTHILFNIFIGEVNKHDAHV
ncbi:MAG: hypothetical protein AAGB31_03890, partial [Bdellovibrio sp.]